MTYSCDIFDQKGQKMKTIDLDTAVFADEYINKDLMYDFVRMQQANARVAIAHTKNRGEVQGSTKKLFKQKGNGTARAGDKKSPIRKKGGVARGPRSDRNFSLSMPKKMRKAALRSALSYRAADSALLGLDAFTVTVPSTKTASSVLQALGLHTSKTLLVVDKSIDTMKSYRNIPSIDIVDAAYVSVFDILKAQKVLFVGNALDVVVSSIKSV